MSKQTKTNPSENANENGNTKEIRHALRLALDLGPLILFFATNALYGIFVATAFFMVTIVAALITSRLLTGKFAKMPLVTAVLVMMMPVTTGQNAIAQAQAFQDIAGVTGIIMTKLDGTARGGILVAIAEKFALPIHAIGVGETVEDLQPFDAYDFAAVIAGADEQVEA